MQFEVSCDEVLSRLSTLFKTKTDAELASRLSVASQTVSTWRGRNKVPYEQLVDVCIQNEVSLDFLVFGKGKPGAQQAEGQIDLEIFKQVMNALQAHESELKGIGFEHLIEHVIEIYNSVVQCETETERTRMLKAQVQLLNKLVAPQVVEKLKSLEPFMEGEYKERIKKDIEKYENQASDKSTSTQHIGGTNHQIAGRDLFNKDKS